MTTFETQLIAIANSTDSLCAKAERSILNGGGWTPAIILGHIVDIDKESWLARFEMMCTALHEGQEPPRIERREPDSAKTSEKYAAFSVTDSTALLRQSRKELLSFLQSLSVADRGAIAMHKTLGAITIESMLQFILVHDEEHRASIG